LSDSPDDRVGRRLPIAFDGEGESGCDVGDAHEVADDGDDGKVFNDAFPAVTKTMKSQKQKVEKRPKLPVLTNLTRILMWMLSTVTSFDQMHENERKRERVGRQSTKLIKIKIVLNIF
jgi:hypothetical protein